MNIAHIIPYMHPAAGGPPVVVEALAVTTDSIVITTSLFCQDDGRELETLLMKRLNVRVLPVDRPRMLGLSSKAGSAIEAAVRTADIVHLHTLWHPLNALARRACGRHGKPYVLSPHGMLDPYSLGVKAMRKRLYMHLVEGKNLRDAACIHFTTPLEEQLARQALPWLGGGTVIPLGAETAPSTPRAELTEAFLSQYPQARNRRRLIFLGRLHPKKGLERVFAALTQLLPQFADLFLIVAGTGEANYIRALKGQVESQGLKQHVLFTGLLRGNDRWRGLAASELFVLPSHQENFAIAAAEALHMGLPVILTDKVNLWPFVEEAKAGVILRNEDAAKELALAIADLMADPQKVAEMGERARRFALAEFTWDAATERAKTLYKTLLRTGSESKMPHLAVQL